MMEYVVPDESTVLALDEFYGEAGDGKCFLFTLVDLVLEGRNGRIAVNNNLTTLLT